jgi:predicted nucleic acid-binding protein
MQMKKEEKLINLMHKIRLCSMEIDWNELKEFQVANLQNGNNKVPITDLIIAQNCIKNNLEIVTADKHFIKMADYLPLKIYKNSQP